MAAVSPSFREPPTATGRNRAPASGVMGRGIAVVVDGIWFARVVGGSRTAPTGAWDAHGMGVGSDFGLGGRNEMRGMWDDGYVGVDTRDQAAPSFREPPASGVTCRGIAAVVYAV